MTNEYGLLNTVHKKNVFIAYLRIIIQGLWNI